MIGFIGLGNMGGAIAERLIQIDDELLVFDKDDVAAARLGAMGATVCSSVDEMAGRTSLVLACLPNPETSLTVARQLASGGRVKILAELSTIGRSTIVEMEDVLGAAGITLVDAPVSGGPLGARQGALSLMLAGSAGALERVAEVCKPACGKVSLVGPDPGQAQLCKLINNGISMTGFLVSCEAVAAAVGAGASAEEVVAHINRGKGQNSGTETKLPRYVLHRTFDMGGALGSALKDQDLFLEEQREAGFPEGVVAGTRQVWERSTQMLDPKGDAATIIRYFEHFTGVEVAAGGGHGVASDTQLMELADGAVASTVLAATCEAIAVGLAEGIAPSILLDVLNAGTARSYWTEHVFDEDVLIGRSASGQRIGEVCEVLRCYLDMAANAGLPACLASRALGFWDHAAVEFGAEADVAVILHGQAYFAGAAWRGAMQID